MKNTKNTLRQVMLALNYTHQQFPDYQEDSLLGYVQERGWITRAEARVWLATPPSERPRY